MSSSSIEARDIEPLAEPRFHPGNQSARSVPCFLASGANGFQVDENIIRNAHVTTPEDVQGDEVPRQREGYPVHGLLFSPGIAIWTLCREKQSGGALVARHIFDECVWTEAHGRAPRRRTASIAGTRNAIAAMTSSHERAASRYSAGER